MDAIIQLILAAVFGTLLPMLFLRFIPNDKVYSFFFNLGEKADQKASQYVGEQNWESVEDSFGSSIMSMAQGFNDGLNSDDAKLNRLNGKG